MDPIANADLVSSLRLKTVLAPDSLLCLDSASLSQTADLNVFLFINSKSILFIGATAHIRMGI